MLRFGFIGLIVAVILSACGGVAPEQQTAEASTAVSQQTQTAAQACRDSATAYSDEMTPIVQEWDDATKLANQTGRGQLANQIAALQAIKRKADQVTVPECAKIAHSHLVDSMNATIDGFLAFMSQKPDATVNRHFNTAKTSMESYLDTLREAMIGRSLVTPTP